MDRSWGLGDFFTHVRDWRSPLDPLHFPCLRAFFGLVGGAQRNRALARDFIRPKPGDRVIDIGCGLASIVRFLPRWTISASIWTRTTSSEPVPSIPTIKFACERVSGF